MLRPATLVALAALSLPSSALAQSEPSHIYEVSWYRAHPGVEVEYSEIYQEYLRPTLDEMIRRGNIVSYLDLVTTVGDISEATHMLLIEYPNWAALDALEAKQDAAAVEVLGRPYREIWEESVAPLRLCRYGRRSTRLQCSLRDRGWPHSAGSPHPYPPAPTGVTAAVSRSPVRIR